MYGFEHRLRVTAMVRKRTMEISGFVLRSSNKRTLRGLWHDSCFAEPDTAVGYHQSLRVLLLRPHGSNLSWPHQASIDSGQGTLRANQLFDPDQIRGAAVRHKRDTRVILRTSGTRRPWPLTG
jgi:hypothetical protein